MKVFISQPFHGRTEQEIMAERERIVYKLQGRYDEPINVIDNYHKENIPDNAGRIWFLGDSIQLMDDADIVVFVKTWKTAKGCQIEYAVALKYNKKIIMEDHFNK